MCANKNLLGFKLTQAEGFSYKAEGLEQSTVLKKPMAFACKLWPMAAVNFFRFWIFLHFCSKFFCNIRHYLNLISKMLTSRIVFSFSVVDSMHPESLHLALSSSSLLRVSQSSGKNFLAMSGRIGWPGCWWWWWWDKDICLEFFVEKTWRKIILNFYI